MTVVITRPKAGSHAVTVGPLACADAAALLDMHDRCSARSRYRRWHGQLSSFPKSYLAALLDPGGDQLAVVARRGDAVIGFASAPRVGPTTRELGILVEDAWQHRGIGRQLLNAVVAGCRVDGTTRLRADVLADDASLLRPLRRLGAVRSTVSRGTITATVDLG